SEGKDSSRRFGAALRASGRFHSSLSLSNGTSPSTRAEGLRTSGNGHSFHRSFDSVPGFWPLGCGNTTAECYGRAAFYSILDKRRSWRVPVASDSGHGSIYRSLFPRATARGSSERFGL